MKARDGNGSVSGRVSAGFGPSGFGFGDDFSPTIVGFGAPKPIGFGFSPMATQWITVWNKNSYFIVYLIIILLT